MATANTVYNPLEGIDLTKERTFIFESVRFVAPRGQLVDANGNITSDTDLPHTPRMGVANPCLIYDHATKRERYIRLLAGHESVYRDEQDTPVKVDDNTVASLIRQLMFVDGTLILRAPQDATAIKFLLLHDDNADNPIRKSGKPARFRMRNVSNTAAEELEKITALDEAVAKWRKVTKENMADYIAHIEYMGVPTVDGEGQPIDPDVVLLNYRRKAESNPVVFNKSFDTPKVKTIAKIKKAISSGMIDLNKVKGQAFWGDTGTLITPLDITKDAVQFLLEFSATDKNFRDRLDKNVG